MFRFFAVSVLALVALCAPAWFDGTRAVALSVIAGLACVSLFAYELLSGARELSDDAAASGGSGSEGLRTRSTGREKA